MVTRGSQRHLGFLSQVPGSRGRRMRVPERPYCRELQLLAAPAVRLQQAPGCDGTGVKEKAPSFWVERGEEKAPTFWVERHGAGL